MQSARTALWAVALSLSACGPSGVYTRLSLDQDGGTPAQDRSTSELGGGGGETVVGTGGNIVPTGGSDGTASGGGGAVAGTGGSTGGGGMVSSGGVTGSGGRGTGGSSSGGAGVPGTGGAKVGSGGTTASGGAVATGGSTATGGAATGGMGTGGAVSTGGSASGGSVGRTIISVDFSGSQTAMKTTEVAGVKAVPNWNNAPAKSGSLTMLTTDDGSPISAAVSWSAYSVYSLPWTETTGDTRMMKGYLDPYSASAPATVTVTGLPSAFSSGYDVYVYAYGPLDSGTRASTYAIGSASVTISQTGASASKFTNYILAPDGGSGNYVLFRGVVGTSFTLTASPGAASGTSTRSPVNGIQIVAPPGS